MCTCGRVLPYKYIGYSNVSGYCYNIGGDTAHTGTAHAETITEEASNEEASTMADGIGHDPGLLSGATAEVRT